MNAFYMTTSWGGQEGTTLEKDYCISEQAAKDFALKNDWNSRYELYKVESKITPEGEIRFSKIFIGKIPSGRN